MAKKKKRVAKKKKRVKNGSPRHVLETKAKQIVNDGMILDLGHGRFKVSSQTHEEKYYDVCFLDGWSCTCEYHQNRHADCKHIIAVQCLVMRVPDIKKVDLELKAPVPKCTKQKCRSTDCRFHRWRERKTGGASPIYKCNVCGTRFTFRPGFLGRHYPDGAVTSALDNSVKGQSLEETVDSLSNRSDLGMKKIPGRTTIHYWIRDANKSTAKIYENITIPVSSHWSADEIYFKTMGRGRYLYAVMDEKSKFVHATKAVYGKIGYNCTSLLKKAQKIAQTLMHILTSDKLRGYKLAVKNMVHAYMLKHPYSNRIIYHINAAAVNKRHINNNRRERLNGIIKKRIKVARGFKTKYPALLELLVTYYNFLRPHGGLNKKTPAEMLGISVHKSDRWASLLAFCSTC